MASPSSWSCSARLWTSTGLRFFFSSRRRHTRCGRDWSSDVCSSDLVERELENINMQLTQEKINLIKKYKQLSEKQKAKLEGIIEGMLLESNQKADKKGARSEERRVGKECRSR